MAPIPYPARGFDDRLVETDDDRPAESTQASLRCHISADAHTDLDTAGDIVSLSLFDLGALAVGQPEITASMSILLAGFETTFSAKTAADALGELYPSLISEVVVETVSDAVWVDSQRAGLGASWIGPWRVRAPWHELPDDVPTGVDIQIDPGTAFGHGAHPSTRLAAELLLRHANETTKVLDLGTGTGVLAIIASRLGADVVAVESDLQACEVARGNIERNSAPPHEATTDRIGLLHGDAAAMVVKSGDLVVANVTLDVQRLLAAQCANAQRLILSGVLCHQVRALQDLYPMHIASTIRTAGEWACVEFSSASLASRKNT